MWRETHSDAYEVQSRSRIRSTIYSETAYVHDSTPIEIQDSSLLWHPKYLFRKISYHFGKYKNQDKNIDENKVACGKEMKEDDVYNNPLDELSTLKNVQEKDMTGTEREKGEVRRNHQENLCNRNRSVTGIKCGPSMEDSLLERKDCQFRAPSSKRKKKSHLQLQTKAESHEPASVTLGNTLPSDRLDRKNNYLSCKSQSSSATTPTEIPIFPFFEDHYSECEVAQEKKGTKWWHTFGRSFTRKCDNTHNIAKSPTDCDSVNSVTNGTFNKERIITTDDSNYWNIYPDYSATVDTRYSFGDILNRVPESGIDRDTFSKNIPRYSYHPKYTQIASPTKAETKFDDFSERDLMIFQKIKEIDLQVYALLDSGIDATTVSQLLRIYEQFDDCYHAINPMHRSLIAKFSISYKKRDHFSRKYIAKYAGKKLTKLPESIESSSRWSTTLMSFISLQNFFCIPCMGQNYEV